MSRVVLAFAAGACTVHLVATLPPVAALAILPPVMLSAARRLPACAAFMAGFALAATAAHGVLADRLPAARSGEDLVVTGTVASLPDRRQQGARLQFRPDRVLHPDLPREIRIAWYVDSFPPEAATRWRLALRLRAPRGALNPDAFDYERWLTARRIGATAVVREFPPPQRLEADGAGGLVGVRARVDRALADALPTHRRRAVIRGLSVGERGELAQAEWETFARTGTAHLMAISGLHVGMVAGLVFAVAAALARRVPRLADRTREAAVVAGLFAAAVYAALAGFAVPTRRALCMLAAGGMWLCLRRVGVAYGAWLTALAVVVATDPLSPLSVGFWLSFAAVAFIVWRLAGRRKQPSAVLQLVRVQWAVALGLLPLTLWFFQRGSLIAPVANLAAVPVFTLAIVPGTLAGAVLAVLHPSLGAPALAVIAYALDVAWAGLEALAAFPWAQRFTPRPPAWAVCAALAGAAVALAPRGIPARLPVAAALFAPMLAWQPAAPPDGGWRLTVLDVGQGLAAVVRTRTHVLVYDAGPSYGPYADAGSRIVVPFLRAQGVRAVDVLMVSHAHDDHQGGVAALRAALPVGLVLAGDPAPLARPAAPCTRGQSWEWDGVTFRVLHPSVAGAPNPNLDSCVLEVSSVAGRALLPGDVEWEAELDLARSGGTLRPVDVVIAPHHGSGTSSTPRFVARTLPRWVVVAAGYGNRWSFPDDAVVARWASVGATLKVTGDHGAVTIDAQPGRGIVAPEAERAARRAWWRAE